MSVYIMYAKKKFGWVFCSWDADKDFSLFYANMSKIHSCKLENKYFMIRYSIVMIAVDFVTTTGHLVLWLNFIHHRWKLVIIKIWTKTDRCQIYFFLQLIHRNNCSDHIKNQGRWNLTTLKLIQIGSLLKNGCISILLNSWHWRYKALYTKSLVWNGYI